MRATLLTVAIAAALSGDALRAGAQSKAQAAAPAELLNVSYDIAAA